MTKAITIAKRLLPLVKAATKVGKEELFYTDANLHGLCLLYLWDGESAYFWAISEKLGELGYRSTDYTTEIEEELNSLITK